ncbi:hypothetical protein Caci_6396 [Catenulispora acidiphila DSM 44928]|uniref:Uncharacterized protein n=1 Tax=Catenulispora acidiphila (strain DSM 44928 / JCM 14897 / NBRC 102108 / NRRL B-24433 / ID139908) TaxID=479433 RepID=C7PWH0_CATAD|nr:hypothetical protein [Catenulispora acidiphila]ACU75250.1 hypothetical protein Caci_6396 [Catenulispora acidiphila DSM 44928]
MRTMFRPAAETLMVAGLLGWAYVAAVAVLRPDALSIHIATVLPMRRDTFGAVSLALSFACAYALRARTGTFWVRRAGRPDAAEAGLAAVGGYAFLVWVYLCFNNLSHPRTTRYRFTHFWEHPSEGTTAVLCFLVLSACLFGLRVRKARHG